MRTDEFDETGIASQGGRRDDNSRVLQVHESGRCRDTVLRWLELVTVVGAVIVVVSACIILSFSYVYEAFCHQHDTARNLYGPVVKMVRLIHGNWTVMLVLLVPLFYRPIYQFLAELRYAFGMERGSPREEKHRHPRQSQQAGPERNEPSTEAKLGQPQDAEQVRLENN